MGKSLAMILLGEIYKEGGSGGCGIVQTLDLDYWCYIYTHIFTLHVKHIASKFYPVYALLSSNFVHMPKNFTAECFTTPILEHAGILSSYDSTCTIYQIYYNPRSQNKQKHKPSFSRFKLTKSTIIFLE